MAFEYIKSSTKINKWPNVHLRYERIFISVWVLWLNEDLLFMQSETGAIPRQFFFFLIPYLRLLI